ncbi:MAG: carbohydrate kinase [Oscillospiraceae bacterium]|nr:carbohydrate kinase [Oscillospiraceae bacterium]
MSDLCVLGEYLIDFTPQGLSDRGLPLYAQNPGGAPTNVACAAAKLGTSSSVITKVSTDALGNFLYDYIKGLGIVELRGVKRSEDPTGLAFVTLNAEGDRDFVFFRDHCADAMLKPEDIDLSLIDECKVFHFSSVSLVAEESREATVFAAQEAKKRGKVVSFDINYRALLWKDEEKAKREVDKVLPFADLVKVSEEEAVLFGGSLEGAAEYFRSFGVKVVLITLGADGSIADNGSFRGTVPSVPVKTLDTTGAGDNFMGAFLAWFIQRGIALEDLSGEELMMALRYANAAGAVCASRYGAIDGQATQEDIAAILA